MPDEKFVVNNDVAREPIIHLTTCRWAREPREKKPENGYWSQEFRTFAEAKAWAESQRRNRISKTCDVCDPLHSR